MGYAARVRQSGRDLHEETYIWPLLASMWNASTRLIYNWLSKDSKLFLGNSLSFFLDLDFQEFGSLTDYFFVLGNVTVVKYVD